MTIKLKLTWLELDLRNIFSNIINWIHLSDLCHHVLCAPSSRAHLWSVPPWVPERAPPWRPPVLSPCPLRPPERPPPLPVGCCMARDAPIGRGVMSDMCPHVLCAPSTRAHLWSVPPWVPERAPPWRPPVLSPCPLRPPERPPPPPPPSWMLHGTGRAYWEGGNVRHVSPRISSRPTDSPSPWPHRTPPRPDFLLPQPPVLQSAWPASTRQLPQECHKPARPDRTPSSAWQHPLLPVSITVFRDCCHDRHQRPYGHSSERPRQQWR